MKVMTLNRKEKLPLRTQRNLEELSDHEKLDIENKPRHWDIVIISQ